MSTNCIGKDKGLNDEGGKKTIEQIKAWRLSGQLPSSSPSAECMQSINDTLDCIRALFHYLLKPSALCIPDQTCNHHDVGNQQNQYCKRGNESGCAHVFDGVVLTQRISNISGS